MLQQMMNNTLFVYVVAGLVGMLCHAVKKVQLKQTTSSLWSYFVHDLPGRTIGALVAFGSATAAVAMSGQMDTMTFYVAAGLGWTSGFSIDSAVNSGR